MDVLIAPLVVAGGIPAANAVGSVPLLLGTKGDVDGNTEAQGFLAVIAALTGVPTAIPAPASATDTSAPASATDTSAPASADISALPPAMPQDAAAVAEITVNAAPVEAGLTPSDELVQLHDMLASLLATEEAPVQPVSLPSANIINVVQPVAVDSAAIPEIQPTPTDIVVQNIVLPVSPASAPPLPIQPAPIAAFQEQPVGIVLPSSFIADDGRGTPSITYLPETLKITDLASQNAFNDANDLPSGILSPGTASVSPKQVIPTDATIAADLGSLPVQPQLVNEEAITEWAAPFVARPDVALVNRSYKKADTVLPRLEPWLIKPEQVSKDTASPVGASVTTPISLVLGKIEQQAAGAFDSSSDGPQVTSPTITAGQTPSTPVAQGITVQDISVKPLGTETTALGNTTLQHATPVDQVTLHIAHAMKEDIRKITIHLEPASLGKVDIRMDLSHDGKTHVAIMVDRPETLELLQKDAKQLQAALNDAGVKADAGSLSFSMRDGGNEQQRFAYVQGIGSYNQAPASDEDNLLSEMQAYMGRGGMAEGIDIRV